MDFTGTIRSLIGTGLSVATFKTRNIPFFPSENPFISGFFHFSGLA